MGKLNLWKKVRILEMRKVYPIPSMHYFFSETFTPSLFIVETINPIVTRDRKFFFCLF